MKKDLKSLKEEFQVFLENEDFTGQIDQEVYGRVLSTLKKRESSGDKKAIAAMRQIIDRWENGDRLAVNYANNLKRYDIDITEL